MDLTLEKKVFLHNLKIVSSSSMILALLYIVMIFSLINRNNLSKETLIFMGEQLLSPVGIMLFVRTTLLEQECRVDEIVCSKPYSYWRTILYRILIISIQLLLLLGIVFIPINFFDLDFKLMNIFLGSYVTSFYLGVMGMAFAYITKKVSVGALIPFLYYFFEMFSKGKYTKSYYLFGMLMNNYIGKIKLFSIAIIFVALLLTAIRFCAYGSILSVRKR